jgi:glycosyltransferase involved in cell wall biosynthesis
MKSVPAPDLTVADIRRRLAYARHVFETIDLFVAPSQALADEFCRLGLPADRVEVADYGFHQARSGAPSPRTNHGPIRIGFVGTLVWHKGVHILVEAARHLRGQFEIHIHGDTAVFPDYVAQLRKSAANLPIVFEGGFDRDHADAIYTNLDVLVVSSLWPENSPLVIHEAFMHHVPVVAARVGGIPGLVRHEWNGLLYDAFKPESLAAALQQLVDDRGVVERLGDQAPPVKSLEQDACEWENRYQAVCAADRVEEPA